MRQLYNAIYIYIYIHFLNAILNQPIVSRGYSITNQKASQQSGHRFCQPNGEANKNKNNFIMKFLDLIVFSALASVISMSGKEHH